MPIYAFGATPAGRIRAPTQIYPLSGDDDARVAFHSWTHTLLHTREGLLQLPDTLLPSALVVGGDKPQMVHIDSPEGRWDGVAVTDAGPALGISGGGVYVLPPASPAHSRTKPASPTNLASLEKLEHPLLRGRMAAVATESRAAILAGGEVLEVVWEWRGGRVRLEVVEEIGGLDVQRIVAGRGDRIGAVTRAGEAYVLEPGGDVRRISLREREEGGEEDGAVSDEGEEAEEDAGGDAADNDDDDDDNGITDLALGPDYELVLASGEVWARGNNDFGQLGQGHTRTVEGWVRVPVPPARRVFAGRLSAVVECGAGA
ncbi:hypothetical protein CC85DRAFT_328117 [Cutaneotrichosporon oleaginosum]|uniref:Uncharacterized protein n=1 Tax=Cutaneotrichosporon oleaginosum TaxID=879819 RepID=A0A0J0XN72_9TREE|nr:uncharacterized protein CC85DRAFT_328117 [Cutaneotrichosporon oleaginosum]KLT42532.1 hypothetical protein CC85DRAFT_328117 [Cutaneotrichosporon oleaginosum]TXT07802.1 hypothetical protein COLE_04726 [Cutaneotrichosporon oleaginosum]